MDAATITQSTITQWRTRIRDDVDANYALCMALAIHQREGGAAALADINTLCALPLTTLARGRALRALDRGEEAGVEARHLT